MIKSFEKSYLFFIFCFIIIAFSFNFDFFWQKASNLNLIDSDDLMRILRVREIFEGKNFYDNIEQRVNAPNGASIHWSRIADFPLYIFQIFARFFTNPQNAENLAIIFVPIILGLIFIFFLGQTAYKLSNSKLSFLYALCLVPIFSTTAYNFQIGRLDHHSLQLILVLGLFYSLIENNFKHGFFGGFCLAISIAIGFEALIIEAILSSALFLLFLFDDKRKNHIYGFCLSLGIFIIIGFFINISPDNYLIIYNDFQSIGQTILILFGAIYFAIMVKYTNRESLIKKLIFAFFGLLILIVILLQFKGILKPLYGEISPQLTNLWLNNIGEIIPLIKLSMINQISLFLPLILALILAMNEIKSFKINEIKNYFHWFVILFALIATGLMTFFYQNRFNIHLGLFIILTFCAILPKILDEKKQKILLGILLLSLPLKIIYTSFSTPQIIKNCNTKSDFAALSNLPKGLVAANIDINVPILVNTNHEVLGIAFHRDTGKENIFNFFTQNNENAQKMISQKNINYIAICAKDIEIETYIKHYPNGFLSNLIKGDLNDKFEMLNIQNKSDIIIYKPL